MTTTWMWPSDLRPTEQVFYVETLTARFAAAMTTHVQVSERAGARWRAELTIQALPGQAQRLDALLAHGGVVLLPVFGKLSGRGVGPSFNDFAASVGPTGFDDDTLFDDALGFYEGGALSTIGGCLYSLALGGCRPGAAALAVGDLIQTSPGRSHLITCAQAADCNGVAICALAPPLRCFPELKQPITSDCRVAMSIVGGDAAEASTQSPSRTSYRIVFEEDLSWPIV